ncbi:MAG: BMP family ABC transporter substrate-binding protein, partial [Candidatus Limnocylindrales bacterium]|nr:BMP family ABC transporter substrate-binding protein [Candidatus Limnocylindrales bacterium]
MRIRSTGLVLFAGLSIILGACSPAASSSAPASAAPETAAPETAAPTVAAPSSDLKIGVVTDVGTVNDKNFNEYTYVGAKDGASAIGATEPPVVVPTSDADYEPLLQAYVDQGFDVIVATGFNLVPATAKLAKANPDI